MRAEHPPAPRRPPARQRLIAHSPERWGCCQPGGVCPGSGFAPALDPSARAATSRAAAPAGQPVRTTSQQKAHKITPQPDRRPVNQGSGGGWVGL